MLKKYLYTFLIAACGGWLFGLLHIPLPWTLGPLTTMAILKVRFKVPLFWSPSLRNLGILFLGYILGSPFTPETGQSILVRLPAIVTMAILTVLFSLICGYFISRLMAINLPSALLGSMPGGLSQMVVLCLELKGANSAVVTLMQTVRLLTVLFTIPFIARSGLADRVDAVTQTAAATSSLQDIPQFLLIMAIIAVSILLAKRLRITGVYASVPVIVTAALVLSGIPAPAMPQPVIAIAQIFVGLQMGLNISIASLANWKKLVFLNVLSVLCVILLLAIADYLLTLITDLSFLTAFISTSPGGMSEMGLTAMMVHADLSTVISFQLFRMLFVLLAGIPLLKIFLEWLPDKYKGTAT